MKLNVLILASEQIEYENFKKIWIENILHFKKQNNTNHIVDFYFIYSKYGEKENYSIDKYSNELTKEIVYFDFYHIHPHKESLFKSMVTRTFSAFAYIQYIEPIEQTPTYFLRTNISTLFDFEKILEWLEKRPDTIFGGTIIKSFNDYDTYFSGTNLFFSKNIVLYLLNNLSEILNKYNESSDDVFISNVILNNCKNIWLIHIKRLDFIEYENIDKCIVFQKCKLYDDDIFCFRFKTFDRENDIQMMKNFFDKRIIEKKSITQILEETPDLKIGVELESHHRFSNDFTIVSPQQISFRVNN